ncbi:MAG: Hpt domain-containing protein [Desulfobulbales bacterium]|nr:Hpt domain-containing protein [Desulfobulbales bacterium]
MTGKLIDPAPSSRRSGKKDIAGPLDFRSCVNMFGGDQGIVLELLHDFLENSDRRLAALSGALTAADYETVRREAHFIKGGAAVLAAHPLMAAADHLEEAAKSRDPAKGAKRLRVLEGEIVLLMNFCRQLKK